ncbi:MAG: hypothetical protein K2F65_04870, partial [Eubacterium sp.]|nr:hypothetical protein [Eubacterium sp.]
LLDVVLDILTRGEITSIFDAVIDIVLYSGIIGGDKEEGKDKNVIKDILSSLFGEKDNDRITWDNAHLRIFDLVEKVFSLIKVENISITSEKDKDKEIALKVVIKDIQLGEDTRDLELSIPRFDLGFVAGIGPGRYTNTDYDANNPAAVKKRTDSFLVIMQYIWKIVQVNKDLLTNDKDGVLKSLLGDAYETAIPFVNSVLDNTRSEIKNGITASQLQKDAIKNVVIESANEIVAALVQFTENTDSSNHYADKKTGYGADADISKVTWDTFFGYAGYTEPEKHVISYPVIPQKVAGDAYSKDNKYTETDVQTTITALTVIAQDALSNILDTTVEGLVADALYTNDIVSAVSKIIFSLADYKTLVTVLEMLGVDLSADSICQSLT